jgi:hypothetical protein
MIDETGLKWLPAARLIELLGTLPPYCRATVNSVGNLLILSADGKMGVGYVDLSEGKVELFER